MRPLTALVGATLLLTAACSSPDVASVGDVGSTVLGIPSSCAASAQVLPLPNWFPDDIQLPAGAVLRSVYPLPADGPPTYQAAEFILETALDELPAPLQSSLEDAGFLVRVIDQEPGEAEMVAIREGLVAGVRLRECGPSRTLLILLFTGDGIA